MLTTDIVIEQMASASAVQNCFITSIFPEDSLREKRIANLATANYVVVAKISNRVVGILFVRKIFFIPNTTWVVDRRYWRQGIAYRLVIYAQSNLHFLTAISRNSASKNLARKAGFFHLPMGIGVWFRWCT